MHTESSRTTELALSSLLCLSLFSKSKASAGFGSGGGKKGKELLDDISGFQPASCPRCLSEVGPRELGQRRASPFRRPPAVLSGWEPGALLEQWAWAPVFAWLFGYFPHFHGWWPKKPNPSQCLLSANLRLMAHLENRLLTPSALEYGRWVWEQDHCKRKPYLVAAQL